MQSMAQLLEVSFQSHGCNAKVDCTESVAFLQKYIGVSVHAVHNYNYIVVRQHVILYVRIILFLEHYRDKSAWEQVLLSTMYNLSST